MSKLEDYQYIGDVNPEYGGAFFDLSSWKDGYVSAVRIQDLGDGGFDGAVAIEHLVILLDRWSGKKRTGTDHWREAMDCCGTDPSDLMRLDRTGRKLALASVFMDSGRYDPDDSWDGYRTHWSTVIQCDEDGPMSYDGRTASYRLDENEDLVDYVLRLHVGTEFVKSEVTI